MAAIAARFWGRLTVAPLIATFLVDRTAEEERRTSPAARALAEQAARAGMTVAIAAAALQSVVYLLGVAFLGNPWIFNVDLDAGVFTWASATATAAAGLLLCAHGFLRSTYRRLLVAAGIVVCYLSLDDQIALHERVGTWLEDHLVSGSAQSVSGDLWQIAYFPLLLFPFLAFSWLAAHLSTRSERRAIATGLACLVAALFAEAIHGPIGAVKAIAGARYYIEVTIEEGLELGAWILLAGVMLSMLLRSVIDRYSANRPSEG